MINKLKEGREGGGKEGKEKRNEKKKRKEKNKVRRSFEFLSIGQLSPSKFQRTIMVALWLNLLNYICSTRQLV